MHTKLSLAFLLLSIASISHAQQAPAANPMANSGIKLDQSALLTAADANKDGKLTKAEWATIKGTESIFTNIDKDADGFLTLAELNNSSPPDIADANKDGKLSVAEFQAILGGGPGAGGGAPPAGAGGPPAGAPPAAK